MPKKRKPKERVFRSVDEFMRVYFPKSREPKPGLLIIIPRPSVGP